MSAKNRVVVVGLDSLEPSLVFERWRTELPNLRKLMEGGLYGELCSTIPPITVPAWMSMFTGHDPGSLGIYGFRNRRDRSYDGLATANSRMVTVPTVWDVIGGAGLKSVVLGVPLTHPPKPINGWMVSGFPLPGTEGDYTYPAELKEEIRSVVGEYMPDVAEFRTDDKKHLIEQVYVMTDRRFALARHLMKTRDWDLFVMVEIGPDRMHHGFWRYHDSEHPKHEPSSPFATAIRDYYRYLDDQLGSLLELAGDAVFVVVSDHGAQRMEGGVCINEWLMREGYLALSSQPEGITRMSPAAVDWDKTLAWGDGGYYGRIFLNVRGREPRGVVLPQDYEKVRSELIAALEAMTDESGHPLGTKVYRPEDVYSECRNIPPDLIVYFGNLRWRSVGSVGHGSVWTRENDIGPDDANHAQNGVIVLNGPGFSGGKSDSTFQICEVANTLLRILGVSPPSDRES